MRQISNLFEQGLLHKTYLYERLGDGTDRLEQLFEIVFRDVIVEVFDGQLAGGLDFVELGFVLRKVDGCTR